ncbi:hypothetical protein JOB18_024870 [Solea senegalensis]|uniref:Uncharacterized protein n=1 Tax=Solea senegalensis TaxID=28829 RepID=A0AAV6PGD9_SOLSE|nr:hypothetical protein JOB18_024870 [Solea senegalensis]
MEGSCWSLCDCDHQHMSDLVTENTSSMDSDSVKTLVPADGRITRLRREVALTRHVVSRSGVGTETWIPRASSFLLFHNNHV